MTKTMTKRGRIAAARRRCQQAVTKLGATLTREIWGEFVEVEAFAPDGMKFEESDLHSLLECEHIEEDESAAWDRITERLEYETCVRCTCCPDCKECRDFCNCPVEY